MPQRNNQLALPLPRVSLAILDKPIIYFSYLTTLKDIGHTHKRIYLWNITYIGDEPEYISHHLYLFIAYCVVHGLFKIF